MTTPAGFAPWRVISSAVQEAEETLDVPVISIVKLADLVVYLEEDETLMAYLPAVTAYRAEFGV